MSLVTELKRRNVIRVGAAYLALAWVIVQITGTVVPEFGLPPGTLKLVIWLGAIGFPFVLLFSWAYELTPEGLKREREIERSESITHLTAKRLDTITIGLLVIAIGMTALVWMMPRRSVEAETSRAEARPTASPQVDAGAAGAVGRASARQEASPQAFAPDARSIAVLPFVNMSSDKEQEYFSDGIAEELLNQLAKIAELKVSARTSSFSFKGQNLEIPEIAGRLHVANVLEGSVRKSGDKVRITAQLVRAADGYHLWSETYDRKIDDIFAVQDEIAGAVVAQLKVALLGAAPKARETSPEAYALFLQARAVGRLVSPEALERSTAMHQQVLALDPSYAPAWAALSANYSNQILTGQRPRAEGVALARAAATKAVELDPEYPQGHAGLGWIAFNYDDDLAGAAAHLERALALDPRDPRSLSAAASLAGYLGRVELQIALDEYLVAQDPVFPARHHNLAVAYESAGRFDEALASYRVVLQLAPQFANVHANIGRVLLMKGEAEAALPEIEQASRPDNRLIALAMAYHSLGRHAESDQALEELIAKYPKDDAYDIGYVLAWRGETDRAFAWLEQAAANKASGLTGMGSDVLYAKLRSDPRWLPFLRKTGQAPEQMAAIKFDVTVPGS